MYSLLISQILAKKKTLLFLLKPPHHVLSQRNCSTIVSPEILTFALLKHEDFLSPNTSPGVISNSSHLLAAITMAKTSSSHFICSLPPTVFFHERDPLLSYTSYQDRKTSDRFHLQLLHFQPFRVGCFMFSICFSSTFAREREIFISKSHFDRRHSHNLRAVNGKAKSSLYWLQSLNNERKSFRKI